MRGSELKASRLRLYLRLPKRIEEEQQVKDLHPEIVGVTLPRQKSRRWCMIELETKSDVVSAIKQLREIKVDGKRLIVNLCRTKSTRNQN